MLEENVRSNERDRFTCEARRRDEEERSPSICCLIKFQESKSRRLEIGQVRGQIHLWRSSSSRSGTCINSHIRQTPSWPRRSTAKADKCVQFESITHLWAVIEEEEIDSLPPEVHHWNLWPRAAIRQQHWLSRVRGWFARLKYINSMEATLPQL